MKNSAKKLASLILAMSMIACLFSACGEEPAASTAAPATTAATSATQAPNETHEPTTAEPAKPGVTYRDTVKIAQISEITNGAYYTVTTTQSAYVARMTHENLFYYDYDANQAIPGLAKEAVDVNGDGKTWKITLNDGIVFHDTEGNEYSKMTASDVKFTYEYISPNAATKQTRTNALAGQIESMDVQDDKTIVFHMNTANFDLPLNLNAFILCEKAVKELGDVAGQEVGSGPYYINYKESQAGVKWTMTRFDGYWGGLDAYPTKNIVFMIISDVNTSSAAMQAGEIDVLQSPGATIGLELENAGFKILATPATTQCMIEFNGYPNAMFENPDEPDCLKLRQAIQYAIDKDALCAIVYATNPSAGGRIDSIIGKRTNGYVDLGPTEFNLEKAQSLMKELGYNENNRLHIMLAHYSSYSTYAQIVQSQLKEIYIDVELNCLDTSVFGSTLRTGEGWDICVNYYGTAISFSGDLTKILQSTGSLAATYGWKSPEMDAKVDEVLSKGTYEEQLKAFAEFQKYLREVVPFIPTHTGNNMIACKQEVEGLNICPDSGAQIYATVRIPEK